MESQSQNQFLQATSTNVNTSNNLYEVEGDEKNNLANTSTMLGNFSSQENI